MNDELNPYQSPKMAREIELPKRDAVQLTIEEKVVSVVLGCITFVLAMVIVSAAWLLTFSFVALFKDSAGGNVLLMLMFGSWLLFLPLGFFLGFKAAINYIANVRLRRTKELAITSSLERESPA